jgi:hypothetical protein
MPCGLFLRMARCEKENSISHDTIISVFWSHLTEPQREHQARGAVFLMVEAEHISKSPDTFEKRKRRCNE